MGFETHRIEAKCYRVSGTGFGHREIEAKRSDTSKRKIRVSQEQGNT